MKEMLMAAFILLIGFVLLIKGADFFVEGSSSVAKILKIPSIIIGMTIVAMGTSLPECAVSVTASMSNNNALAVSNAIGSNIFNLMVVCGTCALFTPLVVSVNTLKREFPFSVICAAMLLLMGFLGMQIGRIDGIVLLIVFSLYIIWMIISAKKARDASQYSNDEDYKVLPIWKCIIYIIGGCVAIKLGGDFVVNGATAIAKGFGLSQTLIGLTVVALGTSLPELATSIVAAKKNEVDMAVGNVIGSNIFNILFVLGIAATISPIGFINENIIDIIILISMSIMSWILAWTKSRLSRKEGMVMLIAYFTYMIYICMR